MKIKIIFKSIVFLFILLTVSCTDNKVKKHVKINKKIEKKYDINANKFPKQSLIVKDVNFIGYFNFKEISKIKSLSFITNILSKEYFLKGNSSVYFTISDFYKSQEFLLFLNNKISFKGISVEKYKNNDIITVLKTDNQEFAYLNFDNDSIYGDISLIKEIFDVYDKKVEPISKERYDIFINSDFLKDEKLFKLIFMPNDEYKEMLLEYSKKQALFKPLFDGLNYFLFELDILKGGSFNLKFVINSKKENIDLIYKFVNTQKKLLMTLNGNPFSKLNSSDIINDINLFKNIVIEKTDENLLSISIDIKESEIGKYSKLLTKLLNTYIKQAK